MSTRAQIQSAAAEVALRLGVEYGVPAARTLELCALAGKAGWRSRLDRLATVLVAVTHARGGVEDSVVRAGSPADLWDRLAHLRAEVHRRCGREADWAAQTRRETRRGGRNGKESWATRAARDAAEELFPGRGSAVRAKRTRWLRSIGAIALGSGARRRERKKSAGGAA